MGKLSCSILLSFCFITSAWSLEIDESFFVEADVKEVRQVIHSLRKVDILRAPVFFLAPSLIKDEVFNGSVLYDRLTGGESANINITAEEDGSDQTKVQVIGVYRNEFRVIGHGLFSNIRGSVLRKLRSL